MKWACASATAWASLLMLGACQAAPAPAADTLLFGIQNTVQHAISSLLTASQPRLPASSSGDSPIYASVDRYATGGLRASDYWSLEEGVGHFSEWSKATKRAFLADWEQGKAGEWTVVMGNEGGDLDSMTAALTWAYHLSHVTLHEPQPRKAIALLQTPADALDLRPENKLALDNSKMSSGHRDLLTIDELPEPPQALAAKLQGIVLVDHPLPLSVWKNAQILSIFDHHVDRGAAPNAHPRVFESVASCTTIVARQMLDELQALPAPPSGPGEYHMPHELLELVLDAIAIDSDGLNPKKSMPMDTIVSRRVLSRSNWRNESLVEVMGRLDKELGKAKKDLSHLSVRDLLRRDWKGDVVQTIDEATPDIHLGFASTPVSLDDQISRTDTQSIKAWFSIERHWTAEISADVSLCLNKYKDPKSGDKVREIILVVRHDRQLNRKNADHLFKAISKALEHEFDLKPHHRAKHLPGRQMVWTHDRADAGRKVVRPVVEKAVKNWKAK
ncbi:hypothetical protein BCV70DRAFT_199361 [Testicularia cyperi]|uniref:DHH phosphoesterase n=1 Tax=Testicularia cyperi TaxID=1882483 RepID=A0A317XUF1_9BASI|nr:hypothetical protein BCV70DRAFT_199361 [Testicularia cyperi]